MVDILLEAGQRVELRAASETRRTNRYAILTPARYIVIHCAMPKTKGTKGKPKERMLVVRVNDALLGEIDLIAERIGESSGVPVTRSGVARMLLEYATESWRRERANKTNARANR